MIYRNRITSYETKKHERIRIGIPRYRLTYTSVSLFSYLFRSRLLVLGEDGYGEQLSHEVIHYLLLFRRKFRQVNRIRLTHGLFEFVFPSLLCRRESP